MAHLGTVTGQREEHSAPCPFLAVDASAHSLRFRFDAAGLPGVANFEEFGDYYIEPETLGALHGRVDALLRGGERSGTVVDARLVGQALYRLLLPEKLRALLAGTDGPLLIQASGLFVPWELLHDGREFWGITHRLARAGTGRPLPLAPHARGARPRILLVGSDPEGTLPFVEQEIAALTHAFGSFGEVVVVAGREATAVRVRMRFQGRYDVIHVCGASTTGATDGLALLLADGGSLPLASLGEALTGEPLLVLDLCAAERGGELPMERRWGERFSEAAGALLAAGALGVIGNLSPVSDRNATQLLRGLYAHLCSGAELGEALRQARIEARGSRAGKRSATWASFVLYGHPCSKPSPTLLQGAGVFVGTHAGNKDPRRRRQGMKQRRLRYVPLVALLALVPLAWLLFAPRGPTRVQIVIGERIDDPAISRVVTNAVGVLRDGLESVAARQPDVLEVVPARQLLCDGRSGAHCLTLLDDVRRAVRLVVTPLRSQDGDYLAVLRLTGLHGDGRTAFTTDVAERMTSAEAFNTGLLSQALTLLNVPPASAAHLEPRTVRAYDLLRQSVVGTMAEVVEAGGSPVALPRPPWRLTWGASRPGDARGDIERFLASYAEALSARSHAELAALQPGMSDAQRAALERYFAFAEHLAVSFDDLRLDADRDRMLVTAWRHDRIEPSAAGALRLDIRVTMLLQRYRDRWYIVDQQHAARRWQRSRRRLESVLVRPDSASRWELPTRLIDSLRALDPPPAPTTAAALWSEDFSANPFLAQRAPADVGVERVGRGEREATVLRIRGALELLLPQRGTAVEAERLVLMARSAGPGASSVQVRFPVGGRSALFWQAVTVSPGSWQEVSLPLRYFRWNHPAVPTWEEVDRLEIQVAGGAELLLARAQLVHGQVPRSAYLSPHEIIAIAFPDRAAGQVRVQGKSPWLVATDAPGLDTSLLLGALAATYDRVRNELPSLDQPQRPVLLLVFADSGAHERFWSRFKKRFEANWAVPSVAGLAFMGVGATWQDESWGDARHMLYVCVHEATHALGTQMVGLAGGRRWLFEGMAERYGRIAAGFGEAIHVQQHLRTHGIPDVADLLGDAPTPPHGYLPAALMVDWLLADPLLRTQLPDLLRTMRREGITDLGRLAEQHLGLTVPKLEEAWHRWLAVYYGVAGAG